MYSGVSSDERDYEGVHDHHGHTFECARARATTKTSIVSMAWAYSASSSKAWWSDGSLTVAYRLGFTCTARYANGTSLTEIKERCAKAGATDLGRRASGVKS